MKGYGQFCPVARAPEVLAERWTPIIVRNLLMGCSTFNDIPSGAPGLSRALLTKRLHELQRVGVIEISPKVGGHGSRYELTQAGNELWGVLIAMGGWAQKWMEVTPEHSDPDFVLWSWCHSFLRHDRLPEGRLLVRFEFATARKGRPARGWLLVEQKNGEICSKKPGFEENLVVEIMDSRAFVGWHLGLIEWEERCDPAISASKAPATWRARSRRGTQARRPTPKGVRGSLHRRAGWLHHT